MEAGSTFDICKLKDLNTKLFDLQTRSLLSDSIIKELEAKIESTNGEIQTLETIKAGIVERQSDLDLAIKTKLETYDKILTTKMQIEFSQSFSQDDSTPHDENRMVAKHLYFLDDEAKNFERVHEKNGLVQEIKKMKLKIARTEREIQKHDENLNKMQTEQNQEFQSIIDRRNKTIVSMVLMWKERQVVEAREVQNKLKLTQLSDENQELGTKIENLEREELHLWKTEFKPADILPILTDLPDLKYDSIANNNPSSPEKKSQPPSSHSSQEKSFDATASSPKIRKLDNPKPVAKKGGEKATCVKKSPTRVIKTRSKKSEENSEQNQMETVTQPAKALPEEATPIVQAETQPSIPDVIDSTPNSPLISIKDPNQTVMDMDDEFETFGSVSSSIGEPVPSPGEVDDVNGSFFGGGPTTDADNWF